MENLVAVYHYNPVERTWDGYIVQYPDIRCYRARSLEAAQEVIYYLTTEELFHRYKDFNSWNIITEIIHHQGA